MRFGILLAILACATVVPAAGQTPETLSDFRLALPTHLGQLSWHAEGFKIIQSSAKSNSKEIGIRGENKPDRLTFLGFLFVVDGNTALTSAGCRDGALKVDSEDNPSLRTLNTSEVLLPGNPPIQIVRYSEKDNQGKTWYSLRGFVARGDLCGDLEFYRDGPIDANDPLLKQVFGTFRLDPTYVPQFRDVFVYGEILYRRGDYRAAAPIFEQALAKLPAGKGQQTMRRVTTDEAGMAYGMAGDLKKARAIFNQGIARDPDYPLNYYNLACADAEQGDLKDARIHLQEAFARKANVIRGESMPNPTMDDSFLPYRHNKEFWKFVRSLR